MTRRSIFPPRSFADQQCDSAGEGDEPVRIGLPRKPNMKSQLYYIKERHNPQTGTYYVACGQMTSKDARDAARPLYGSNVMHGFNSKEEYDAECKRLGIEP